MPSYYYKYQFDITFQIESRNMYFKPYSLIEFVKDCDYFNSFIPVFSMDVKIQDRNLLLLRTFDKELTVFIKLIRWRGLNREEYTDKTILFESTFIPFYDKNRIPDYTSSNKKVKSDFTDMNQEYEIDTPGSINPVQIHMNLILKEHLLLKKVIHNYILGTKDKKVSPITAAAFILDQNPSINKYIMDPPDNTNDYDEILIKPGDLKNAIQQIQMNYGIYNKDILLFSDVNIFYMLNKLKHEHFGKKDEIFTIGVLLDERVDKVNPTDSSVVDEENKIVIYNRTGNLTKDDKETVLGEYIGDKIIYSNFDSVINSVFVRDKKTTLISPIKEIERPVKTHVSTGVKKIVDYDMLNNQFNMNSYMYSTCLGVPISFMLTSVNYEDFTPNKRIKLNLDNPESRKLYSGLYNIARAKYYFNNTTKPGEEFMMFCHCNLTLVNKTDGYDKDYIPESEQK